MWNYTSFALISSSPCVVPTSGPKSRSKLLLLFLFLKGIIQSYVAPRVVVPFLTTKGVSEPIQHTVTNWTDLGGEIHEALYTMI